jgi:hypothetical protein
VSRPSETPGASAPGVTPTREENPVSEPVSELSPREARLAFALLKLRQSQIAAALKKVTPFVDQEPGDRAAAKLGAARLGRVAMTEPDIKALVTDRDAFTKFVQAEHPGEVETVVQVRPAYESKLLGEITARGAAVDEDGQAVPGVTFGYGSSPQQRFYPDEGAEALLAVVDPSDLPRLEGVDLAGILGVRDAGEGGGTDG